MHKMHLFQLVLSKVKEVLLIPLDGMVGYDFLLLLNQNFARLPQ